MRRDSKEFMITFIIIGLNLAVYISTSFVGGNFVETNYELILQYGQVNSFVMSGGYWQLVTAMFVHVSLTHLLGNMLFLLIFGLRAEELFAAHEYLLVYFLSGLAGNLLTLLFGPYALPSAGASGAIFGMFGAVAIYVKRMRRQSIIGALLYSFFLFAISAGPNVNNFAHFGGLAVGLLVGYVLAAKRKTEPAPTYEYKYSYTMGH